VAWPETDGRGAAGAIRSQPDTQGLHFDSRAASNEAVVPKDACAFEIAVVGPNGKLELYGKREQFDLPSPLDRSADWI
jgi:hypothetical protein